MADDDQQPLPKPKLSLTVGPKSEMTPGPPGDTEKPASSPDMPTPLNATQRAMQGVLERYEPKDLPHVGDDDAGNAMFEKLLPGQKFTDSAGKVFTKPWIVKDDDDFEKVPEGASFVDAQGNKFTKPKFQPISATAQMLYEMAQTPDAKEQALKTIYGDKVKRYPSGDLYVDDNGTPRKPGARDIGTFAATSAASTAPAIGMGIGEALGGPPGATAGAATGRQFNNSILALFGVHQPAGEQVSSAAWEGAGVAIGQPIGKAITAIPGAVKAVTKSAKDLGSNVYKQAGNVAGGKLGDVLEAFGVSPKMARGVLGLTDGTRSTSIYDCQRCLPEGARSPLAPSVLFPEAPGLAKIEQFNRVFRAQAIYSKRRRKILRTAMPSAFWKMKQLASN